MPARVNAADWLVLKGQLMLCEARLEAVAIRELISYTHHCGATQQVKACSATQAFNLFDQPEKTTMHLMLSMRTPSR